MKSCQKEIYLGPGSLLLVREADAGTNSPGWDQGTGERGQLPTCDWGDPCPSLHGHLLCGYLGGPHVIS